MAAAALLASGCAAQESGASPSDLALSASCELAPGGDAPTVTLAHPEGWRLDLAGQERDGARPVLVGTAADTDGVAYAAAVDVLDEMAHAIRMDDREDLAGVPVARFEEVAPPREVVAEDGCLRLYTHGEDREQVDEACDLDQDGVSATHLGREALDVPVLAGTAPGDADVVGFDDTAHADSMATGAVPLPDGRTGFAFVHDVQEPRELLVRTFDGEEVGATTVDPAG